LSQCKEIWRFFLNFGRILAIESFKNNMILAISIFNAAFWLYKASKKKRLVITLCVHISGSEI